MGAHHIWNMQMEDLKLKLGHIPLEYERPPEVLIQYVCCKWGYMLLYQWYFQDFLKHIQMMEKNKQKKGVFKKNWAEIRSPGLL